MTALADRLRPLAEISVRQKFEALLPALRATSDPACRPVAHGEELFRRWFLRAVDHVIGEIAAASGSERSAFEQFPFLRGYADQIAANGWLRDTAAASSELQPQDQSGERSPAHLPLAALCGAAGIDAGDLLLLLTVGLAEEDMRFGGLFEAVQGMPGHRRPCVGLLRAWFAKVTGPPPKERLRALIELGLLEVLNADAPRGEWAVQVPALLWDALPGPRVFGSASAGADPRRRQDLATWVTHVLGAELLPLDAMVLPEHVRATAAALPGLMSTGDVSTIVIRGPRHNGRRTLAGALARLTGRDVLEVTGLAHPDDPRWKILGPLATLIGALPVVVLDLAPGDVFPLTRPAAHAGPLVVILGPHSDFSGTAAERVISIDLPAPDARLRRRHWELSLAAAAPGAPDHANTTFDHDDTDDQKNADVAALADQFRYTSGHIRATAAAASAYARLAGRGAAAAPDVRLAARALHRQALDALVQPVPAVGGWERLAAPADLMRELRLLEARCRHRERLWETLSPALTAQANAGVRALFDGPSGTGKTLAASVLAAVLDMQLYRLDLSAAVNKYIGETEKNLNRVFTLAEELDVILLLDEGDALLTQRTGVHTSNDRYANLETNFLLQRVESFSGILVVTTNAGDRIDSAFQRRMDVAVEFRPPEAAERWAIWKLHLTAATAVEVDGFLREVASRCALTGGEIRNAVLHASLLALEEGRAVSASHLEAAVRREYRKKGASCPLRAAVAGSNDGHRTVEAPGRGGRA